MMKYDILNRFSGVVIFTAEIDCSDDTLPSIKLGLAVKVAVKARANLVGAYLARAYLEGAKGLKIQPAQTIILPEGDLIVYKKLAEGVAKLKIPFAAKRSNATGRKCRVEYAKVIELPKGVKIGHSRHDGDFEYKVGKIVRPDKWDDNWASECSNGIHFL